MAPRFHKLDGLDILKRSHKGGRAVPVIIVIARDGVDDRMDGLDLRADAIKNVRGVGWMVDRAS